MKNDRVPGRHGSYFYKLDEAKNLNFWSAAVNHDTCLVIHGTALSLLLIHIDLHRTSGCAFETSAPALCSYRHVSLG